MIAGCLFIICVSFLILNLAIEIQLETDYKGMGCYLLSRRISFGFFLLFLLIIKVFNIEEITFISNNKVSIIISIGFSLMAIFVLLSINRSKIGTYYSNKLVIGEVLALLTIAILVSFRLV